MGELAASIAHEINQPLGSALANAAAAARWLDTEPPELVEAKKTIQDILADVRRASDVIKSLRALTSKSLPSFTRFALNDATMQTIKLIKGELDYRKVSVSFDLTDDVEVLGDRVQIQQVILNLLLNAIEATTDLSERTGAIRLSSNLLADRRIKVCVEDNGPGVSEEARRHIFDAFYTTKPSGIGMGLSICRSIVEAHLGVLDHTPAEPVGSSFCFTLPLADQICIKRASIADVSSGPRSWFLQRSPNEDV
jgi:signal transduction histidine kinase